MLARPISSRSTASVRLFSTARCSFKSAPVQQANHDASNENPTDWATALPYEKIPGPKDMGIFSKIIGQIMASVNGNMTLKYSTQLRKEYGPIVKIPRALDSKDSIMLFDPVYAEQMFRNEGVWPIRDTVFCVAEYKKSRPEWFGENTGLATESGEKWASMRSIVNPILMQPRVAVQYTKNMDIVAQDFIEKMKEFLKTSNQMPADFDNELNKWALESICLIAIDKRMGCLAPNPDPKIQEFINSVLGIFDLIFKLDFTFSLHKLFPTPDYKKFVNSFDFVCRTIMGYLDEAEEKFKNSVEKAESEKSAFEKLLKINRQIAFNIAVEMLMAGIDTTSKTVGAALYYLAKNPDAQEALRKELKELLPTKDTPITKEVLEKAKYLKAVIKETQRFAPIGIGNLRRIPKDVVIGGYQIPKDTNLLVMNLVLCLNDFPKANEFIPERWLRSTEGELSHKNMSAFTTLPFGFGPRSCVGKRLAQLELEILIAKVIRNFKLEWHHKDMTFKAVLLYGIGDPLQLTVLNADD